MQGVGICTSVVIECCMYRQQKTQTVPESYSQYYFNNNIGV